MDLLNRQFGLIIAYLLPGFIGLTGLAPFVPIVARWFDADQTVGVSAPIYALLAATAIGMTISAFRWFIVDRIHGLTGLGAPAFNAKALQERPTAYLTLVESHYKFHQFYANTLVAVVWTYGVHRWLKPSPLLSIGTDVGVLILCSVLFASSRDALSKYRSRITQLIQHEPLSGDEIMTNGIDHSHGPATSPKPKAAPKTPDTSKEKPKPSQVKPTEK